MPEEKADEKVHDQGGTDSGDTPPAKEEFDPIGSQEEFEKRLGRRLERERAKYADYDDLKSKARKWDEADEANKSELDKAIARAEKAEAERDTERATALRWQVASAHGISAEDAELFLTGTDKEALTAQAKRLSERDGKHRMNGNHVPTAGRIPSPPKADERQQFADYLTGRANT